MSGYEQPGKIAAAMFQRGKLRLDRQNRVDRRVSRHEDLAGDLFLPQVLGRRRRRCEQQARLRIDGGAIFLLGPGEERVVSPEPRLYMGDRNSRGEAGKRGPQRARRVALHHEKVGTIREQGQQRRRDRADMAMGVLLPWTLQMLGSEAGQTEVGRIQAWMLSGEDQIGQDPMLSERVGKRRELDCFRPCADHEPDIYAIQSSP